MYYEYFKAGCNILKLGDNKRRLLHFPDSLPVLGRDAGACEVLKLGTPLQWSFVQPQQKVLPLHHL